MDDFPGFMKDKKNLIAGTLQFSKNIEEYIFDGVDAHKVVEGIR
jgi:hypothetical protein